MSTAEKQDEVIETEPANDNRKLRRADATAADLGWSSAEAFVKWCLREGFYVSQRGRVKFVDLNELYRGVRQVKRGEGKQLPKRRSSEEEVHDAVNDTLNRKARRG